MSYSLSLSVENSTVVCLPFWMACVSPAAQRAKQYMHSWARSYSLAINALQHAARVSVRTRSSQALGMYRYMMKHYDPRGCGMLSLHRCAQGNDAADASQVLSLCCSRRSSADHQAPLHADAQLSFSRSRVHVCLQALLVPVFVFECLGAVDAYSFHLS